LIDCSIGLNSNGDRRRRRRRRRNRWKSSVGGGAERGELVPTGKKE
jgi:hypothetical protein